MNTDRQRKDCPTHPFLYQEELLDKEPPTYWIVLPTKEGTQIIPTDKDRFLHFPEHLRFEGTKAQADAYFKQVTIGDEFLQGRELANSK